ncbi:MULTISPECIES: GGDEF domain-containing protein [unclassified Sphingomonas]|uniref:GGDEF domain-containing protein n=1 Tax=unclassified Sphingomonas TaxID=196159 RepID=UPI000B1AF4CD|nr:MULTISPECIES: diguanylate cyclase [unclassified Sphingomonas]
MRYQLTPVTAQFRDAGTEQAFRVSILRKVQEDSWLTLIVAAAGMAMFGISDYGFLGLAREFYLLLGIRATLIATCLALAIVLRSSDALLTRPWLLSVAPALIATGSLALIAIRPETLSTQLIAVVVVVMAFYLFSPILLWGMIGTSLYLGIGFLLGAWHWGGLPWETLRSYGLLLIMANVVGYVVARRLARLQRQQFELLNEERRSKQRLLEEVGRREALEKRLRIMADTDELTGLANRRSFLQRARTAFDTERSGERPFSLCMIDLDNFKAINDRWGHACGDRVLREVAAICLRVFREGDAVGRFGGEEFVAALPGADMDEARRIAERLRAAIAGLRLDGALAEMRATVTVGLAEVRPLESGLEPALKRADAALYQGKRSGRNIVLEDIVPDAE